MKYYLQIDGDHQIVGFSGAPIDNSPFKVVKHSTNEKGFCPLGKQLKGSKVVENLEAQKEEYLGRLELAYGLSRTLTIQNGLKLVIPRDAPERGFFLNKLELACTQTSEERFTVFEYRQTIKSECYQIRALAYLWKYVFKDFRIAREQKRFYYDECKLKISNAKSSKELDNLTWQFNERGFIVDVNEKAQEIVGNADLHPPKVLEAIEEARSPDGLIHLVKKLSYI